MERFPNGQVQREFQFLLKPIFISKVGFPRFYFLIITSLFKFSSNAKYTNDMLLS